MFFKTRKLYKKYTSDEYISINDINEATDELIKKIQLCVKNSENIHKNHNNNKNSRNE